MEACPWVCQARGCVDGDAAVDCPLTPGVTATAIRMVISTKQRVSEFTMNRGTRTSSQQEPPALRRPRLMHCTRDAANKARERIPKSNQRAKPYSAESAARGVRSFRIRQNVPEEKPLRRGSPAHRSGRTT